MRIRIPASLLLLVVFLAPSGSLALQEDTARAVSRAVPAPVRFESHHSGTFDGTPVEYRASVADVRLERESGAVYASVFTTAYVREGEADPARPITFVFNGGPGSASLWLHMGLLGPRRVEVPGDAAHPGPPPYRVVDNRMAPLDVTDLVFIDPPGTGYSRLVGDGKAEDVWGLREDARTMAAVVRGWIRANGAWNRPVYLAGESFGTTRAAAMLPELMRGSEPIAVSGVILVSQAMDYTGSTPYVEDNLLAYVTYLPTMAATAWYHGKVERGGRTLETFLDEVRRFAVEEYLPALFRGSAADTAARHEVARRYASLTGLDAAYVMRAGLQVNPTRFVKELLREEGLVIGRLDGRYTADEIDDLADRPSFDAASAAISAAYSAAMHEHMRSFLGVEVDRPYHASGPEVGRGWVWDRGLARGGEPHYVNTAPDLAWAMSYDPGLRVFVAAGYYDYATPFFDAEYTLARHGIDMARVAMKHYEAGHMMYVHDASLEALATDIREFLRGAAGQTRASG